MSADSLAHVRAAFEDGARLRLEFADTMGELLVAAAERVAASFHAGGKLLLFGNGGSAADAQHVAAEFVNRFLGERRALPALALTTDTSALTSIGNDRSFDEVFARQVEAFGARGDVAIAISTSGSSPNVLRAAHVCRARGVYVIGLTGRGGGDLAAACDLVLDVPGTRDTARIQEVHIAAAHVLCELVEKLIAGASS